MSNLPADPTWDVYMARHRVEFEEKWREFVDTIPHIQFPANWLVQVIPPFGGAMARFRVTLPDGIEKSIYLDTFGRLGFFPDGKPYWEVYPHQGDVGRCEMSDVAELLKMIADVTPGPTYE